MTGAWGRFLAGELVAGLWVGQAFGVFYHLGFGLVVPAPGFLGTHPLLAAQSLILFISILLNFKLHFDSRQGQNGGTGKAQQKFTLIKWKAKFKAWQILTQKFKWLGNFLWCGGVVGMLYFPYQ